MRRTRRRVLAYCGSAVGATTALGGCVGTFGSSGGSGDDEALFDRAPFYAWLPTPDSLGADHLGFRTYSASSVREHSDSLSDRIVERFRRSAANNAPRPFDFDPDRLDYVTSVSADPSGRLGREAGVVAGSFSVATARSALESNSFEAAGSDGEYDRYRSTGPRPRTAAVADGVAILVENGGWDDPAGAIEALVAAERGQQRRYVDTSDDFATLAGALGTGFQVTGSTAPDPDQRTDGDETERIPGQVAGGLRAGASDDGTLQSQLVAVFPSPSEADPEAVRTYLRETESMLPIRPDAPISTDGRVVTATQELPG